MNQYYALNKRLLASIAKGMLSCLVMIATTMTSMAQTTLSTYPTKTANNGSSAITFEVTAAVGVNIQAFETTCSAGPVDVWYRPGGVLHPAATTPSITAANGWVLHQAAVVITSNGTLIPSSVPLSTPIQVPLGQTYGFCLTGSGMRYQNAALPYTFSNSDITITTGPPNAGFGGTITSFIASRELCGSVTYTLVPTTPNNAGVDALVTPTAVCPGLAPVEVAVRNYGTNTLTSFNVHGTIFDGTTTTTLPTVNITSVSIATNGSMNVAMGNYNFQAGKTYDMSFWTTLPNGVADTDPGNDSLISNGFMTSLSGTYTVGTGMDFPDMVSAANALSNFGLCGPVTFNVNGSQTFNGQVVISNVVGSSSTNTITFKGHGATLVATPSASNYAVVTLDGVDYVTLDSFNIVGNDPTYGWGIYLTNAADHNTITNNTIDLTALTSTLTSNGIGIAATMGFNYSGYGNTANFTLVKGNTIKGGTTGLYNGINFLGTSTTVRCQGNQIIDNTIKDVYIYSLRSYYQEDGVIAGNDISRPTKTGLSSFYGIYMYYNLHMNVNGNRIHHGFATSPGFSGTVYAIYCGYDNSISSAPTIFSNNVISDNETNGTYYAIYHLAGGSVYYYHNTISMDYANQTGGTNRALYQTSACTDFKFKNNNISITNGGSGTKHGLYFNTNTSVVDCNYNNIYMNSLGSGTQYTGRWNATDYATLANWQTANTNAYDQNSVAADPIFALPSQGIYQPSSPSINNIGTPLAAVTTDILGVTRNAVTPDPGAWEFSPANDDAGIIAINGVTSQCPGTVNVTAELKNFGVSSLFSASIQWKVNGVAQPNVPFIGSLGTTNTTTVNLGSISMVANTPYDIVAWTTQPNGNPDGNHINDTTKVLGTQTAMSGIYTVGTTGDFTDLQLAANALNTFGICGPVTINVSPGTYNGQIIFDDIAGTSSTNTITVNGNGATISAAPTAANYSVIRINGTDYLTLDSLNIVGTDATYGWGIHMMNAANNCTIKNCIIDLTAHTSTTSTYGCGIAISSSTTSPTGGGDNANNCVIMNNHLKGGLSGTYYGITMYGLSTDPISGMQIINNTIEDFYYYYIYMVYASDNLIKGNDINRNTKTSYSSFYGIYNSTGSTGNIIEENRIHNTNQSSSTAITVGCIYIVSADASSSNPTIVRNNMIYNIMNTGTTYALYNSGSDNVVYYYNTLSLDNPSASGGTVYSVYQTTMASGLIYKNNLFSVTQAGSGTRYGFYFNTNTSLITSDNNIVYVNGPSATNTIGRWNAVNYSGLAAWTAASTFDANSDSLNPNFLDMGNDDYTPNTFSGNNIGTPIAGITTDFYGALRSTTTPDPGAIEFVPIPTNDSCHQAIPVIAGVTLGTTLGATTDLAPTCTVSDGANGVWYSYVAAGDFVTFSLCGSTYDTRLRVFEGTCASLTCVAGNEDFCSTQSEVSGCTKNGVTYYILVHGNGVSANGEFTLTITETPVTPAVITPSASAFCPGDSVVLSANTSSSYLWSDAGASTSQDLEVSVAGTYYVVTTDANGCTDTSASVTITQHTVVPPVISVLGDSAFCSGDSVVLSSSPGASYLWNDPNMSTTPTITVTTGGTFTVYTVDANGCGETSAAVSTTELPLPVVDLGDDQELCDDGTVSLDAGAGHASYFWSTGATSQTINFSGSVGTHTINVTVTDANGCQGTDQIEILVKDCTGIDENSDETSVNVFPNPGNGVFHITLNGFKGDYTNLNMTDYQGKVVHSAKLQNTNATQLLDLSHLANGIYMMTLTNGNQLETMKLIIK